MGYNSSPFTAFLMTLFNVRLGAWLPNPGTVDPGDALMARSGPRHAIAPMLNELIGKADTKGKYVYLSDGGHFDNLGLYEMLRRRCSNILVVDSGRDTDYAYADLGHVLQSALIDLGVQVRFRSGIKTDDAQLAGGFHYADIFYPPNQAEDKSSLLALKGPPRGRLIYLKPYLPDDLPVELLAYHGKRTEFPNETTANQFFTESDFESYRRLGEILTNRLLQSIRPQSGWMISDMFQAAEAGISRAQARRAAAGGAGIS